MTIRIIHTVAEKLRNGEWTHSENLVCEAPLTARGIARANRALDEDRAAFLAARSARLADSHALVIEKRGLDNSTVTITEPLTAKWQTATAWTTAAPSTMIVTVDRVTTVTSVSTKTEYKGVTKVVKTVTAVSFETRLEDSFFNVYVTDISFSSF